MKSLLVLGGARSGKSRYAQQRIEALDGSFAYIATAQAFDHEMEERIALHRADRDERWHAIEAPFDLAGAIRDAAADHDAILVDCLTLWLSNCLLAERDVKAAVEALVAAVMACPVPIVLVANEVGLGIVPDNALARLFRDEAGRLNQTIAAIAQDVVFIAAGLPIPLKGLADNSR
ncbi:bifunctional adenosylcobinamide kinase/adenosylcobinamide-phosphate guanylyltransferase [Novosphingobium aquimarinum]|uniref:bifunctional adenosylcobinamide kinase/adenosylcobinamide-phosphate guanylyltransferase n=1 Tax=Novosphingobium aquimarinum TaxID=2682494 RepID=UPI0018DCAB34|nr:bifunctional adenosylcobinamide kinase/adenosylcobinamide-phosphate guanylyltransferase [Novosphingobium aquimarinum]